MSTESQRASAAAARRRRTEIVREARGLVVSLIQWEISAADGDRMADACEKYGYDQMVRALEAIQSDLRRKGASRR